MFGGSDQRVITIKRGIKPPRWRQVFNKTYPEAKDYRGKATHEDVAFLVDPLKIILGNWEEWARTELPTEIEGQYAGKGQTPLQLKIYVGTEKVLFGLIEYPAVRVESWHHGSPGITLVLALAIGLVIIIWIFLAWLFKRAEEIDWKGPLMGLGLLGVVLVGLMALGKRKEKD